MRQWILLVLFVGLLCGIGTAPLWAAPKLTISSVGFDGYYRSGMLVPVAVTVTNDGPDIHGELRITSDEFKNQPMDSITFPVVIPQGATQLRQLTFIPVSFARQINIELWSRNRKVAENSFNRCQEIYNQGGDRLVVIVGGSGSSLSYLNNQPIKVPQTPAPRPWELVGGSRNGYNNGNVYSSAPMRVGRGANGNGNGTVRIAYGDPKLLPDNPEAYSSVNSVMLMSDITENSLSADAQRALAVWAANGGNLIVAGGGVPARLSAPFFAQLLPLHDGTALPGTEQLSAPLVGGSAYIRTLGSGAVTQLTYDPDQALPQNWQTAAAFLVKLIAREPRLPITFNLTDSLQSAVEVNNLRPPNLTLIVLYLIIYLILLVPVNYFVLRKMDRREMAWMTTPAIVLLFTFGAYGIGYATKGHRLIFNLAGVMETTSGQHDGEIISRMLLFSPSRTSYRLDLGHDALLVRNGDADQNSMDYRYQRGYSSEMNLQPLMLEQSADRLLVNQVSVNQWAFRRFTAVHEVSMGQGVTGSIAPGAAGAVPRAGGTITNGTSFAFKYCLLYQDGAQVAAFELGQGQSVNVAKVAARDFQPSFSPDEQKIFDVLKNSIVQQVTGGASLHTGTVMIGFTTQSLVPAQLNRRAVRTEVNAVIVHL